ncbi:GNAT family N-acetyltransferase [Caldibacillus thermolactis]|jgi:[ribosomal protein S5]-alanine N-acetyltransferase|uniref:GNAT family N-acetyltransferase n=2 Tax=Pallidibacillus thermolactis TaxID=251051 RepID=A0ABT2WKC5_9BACI|nr:GNAT family N-acetyltransferase [Pallidibacillus thermolactis]MCU9595887.1 GNAT family N-acetyltransferase [Pallidibacillus thermolactis]MCU9602780.1 GNAT family N-acetyltransferase [Pallidibacillus thermolactis subsp. kokeshiiformis]
METLFSERLILRQWKESDSKDLYEYAKSELVGPNAGWAPHNSEDESKEVIKLFIEENDTYAVVLKEENKVIGSVGLHDRQPDKSLVDLKQKEIGYVLNPDYWGRGMIPEAVNRVIQYGFEKLDLDIIWCGHFDFNYNSKRVCEKCGFQYRFKKKNILKRLGNKEVTSLYYSLTKEEYFNSHV